MNLTAKIQLAILALAAIAPANAAENDAAAVFEKAKKSVVVVRVFDADDNQSAQGSGVITAENEVTTNCHVVENAVRVEVVRQGEEKPIAAEVANGDAGRDLCLLSAKGLINAATIRKAKDLTVGENVYAVGSPQGLEFSISGGIISQLRSLGGSPPLIQTDAAISEGSSGGGLFDGEGNLVGITTFYYRDGQNLNFAIPSEWIADARLNQSPFSESESAPQISSGSFLDFYDKAVELEKAEDWNGLLAHCKRWTEAESENALAQFSLGVAYDNINHYDDAIAAYREALRINPEDADVWYNLGNAYGNLDRHDDAIAAFREAVQTNPEDASAWNNLGVAYGNINRYDDEIAAYREALRINPKHADAWHNLGVAYGKLDRHNDEIAAYREAVRINPEYADAWYNLGYVYDELGHYDDAIASFREALRINPKNAYAWDNLGITYNKLRRYDDAIVAWRKALRINPKEAGTWYNLGVTYALLKRYDDSIAATREAVRINPNFANGWKLLGLIYDKLGRTKEAEEARQKELRAKILSGE